ncbi:GcvT family protein [Pontivivens insulae]|uniref:4-methylaminobutanoate oxidase (Formaldehyde-forming) n=1 Tax=Pontivivens insulae TaxID=1639689 RepID=A0A2R8AG39_9RHOB|nr:FAD-dependent oxidoreductase [Pontivivens insulae]RED12301.1 dimethylglycine dehydrogenase [Pontivivens insulae]SPF31058.1 4-methylaminobutanoate oxidase (formaldehyde-forming) [Pontivivens insulae]
MTQHYRAIVIGGGVVGASVLYHLTKKGWSDVALLERDVLTCGSSWHAAGGFHTLNGDPNVAKLQQYTVELYKEIEEMSGQSCGLHLTGGVQLAKTKERMESLYMAQARGRYMGMELDIVTPEWAKERFPILNDKEFIGGLWDPIEGHLDPSGTTHAYAKCARMNGAKVHEKTKVEDIRRDEFGTWHLTTSQGVFTTDNVINAGGLWAREVGRMVGLELPVLAMEHHYLLTERVDEVADYKEKNGEEVIHIIDFEGEIYTRQERDGVLLGTYERAATPWQPRETPWNFSAELLEPDFDRIAPSLEVAFKHFPALENVGIRQAINGPFTFAPDGNPLVGPIRGLPGYWSACAVMAGFSQGGGVGLALSNWIVDGDPGFDVWGMDVSRFGDWATLSFTNEKVRENYSRRFRIRFPNEELPAARPLRTNALYDKHLALGGQMGASYGMEVPLWYAPEGVEEEFSWRRSTDHVHVGKEVATVREGVGIMDISGFSKFAVSGEGSHAFLDKVLACKLPAEGRMTLAPMLNENGKLIGDLSVANMGDYWWLAGSGIAEEYYLRHFERYQPDRVKVEAKGLAVCGISIAGPKSRELLAKVALDSVAHDDFKFMAMREMLIGHAMCMVGRVSYTGDLGYEIWMETDYARYVWDLLMAEGAEMGIAPIGMRALNSLRLEKNWSSWGREYRPVYGALEAGLDRFVAYHKAADFVGKAAAIAEKDAGGTLRLVTFKVDAADSDPIGDEPIWFNGEVRGWITSGGYAHNQCSSMAQGYVPKEIAAETDGWEVEVLGEKHAMRLQPQPAFDANASRMRS